MQRTTFSFILYLMMVSHYPVLILIAVRLGLDFLADTYVQGRLVTMAVDRLKGGARNIFPWALGVGGSRAGAGKHTYEQKKRRTRKENEIAEVNSKTLEFI